MTESLQKLRTQQIDSKVINAQLKFLSELCLCLQENQTINVEIPTDIDSEPLQLCLKELGLSKNQEGNFQVVNLNIPTNFEQTIQKMRILSLEEVAEYVKKGQTPPDVQVINDGVLADVQLSQSKGTAPPRPWLKQ